MTTKTTKAAKAPRVGITVDAASNITGIDAAGVEIKSDAFRADMNDPTKSGAEAVADALKSQ